MLKGILTAILAPTVCLAANFPLTNSVDSRSMVDAKGNPFMVIGDGPHSLVYSLNTADATTYLINRGTNGFNTLWFECLCDSYVDGYGTEGTANYGKDVNGNNPFTSTLSGGYYDFTTPNSAYWSHVDWLLVTAGTNGMQFLMTPLDQGGWTTTSLANGTNRCYQYGQFLGNRYKGFTNIFWNLGNDFQLWATATNDAVIMAIADGIKSKDTSHPMTVELDYYVSDSLEDANWASRVSVNGIYTYYPAYAETLTGYNRSGYKPCLMLESNYEFENNTGNQPSSPLALRVQEYWSCLAGCLAGQMYGNHYTWTFTTGWQSQLNTTGMTNLMTFNTFFMSKKFYNLVPDQGHTFVTSGYGTYSSSTEALTGNNYRMAAITPDGTLGLCYVPSSATLTVAMSAMTNTITARWFDPTAGTYSSIAGSPFANTGTHNFATPGNNAAGDPDWVLDLEATFPVKGSAPTAKVKNILMRP